MENAVARDDGTVLMVSRMVRARVGVWGRGLREEMNGRFGISVLHAVRVCVLGIDGFGRPVPRHHPDIEGEFSRVDGRAPFEQRVTDELAGRFSAGRVCRAWDSNGREGRRGAAVAE